MEHNWFGSRSIRSDSIYGALCGIALAVMFLTIGFWKTILISFMATLGWMFGSRNDKRLRMKAYILKLIRQDKNKI